MYVAFLKPLSTILYLKFKLGNSAAILYHPLLGHYYYVIKEKEDSSIYIRKLILANPNLKVILTNYFNKPVVIFVDPDYCKIIY